MLRGYRFNVKVRGTPNLKGVMKKLHCNRHRCNCLSKMHTKFAISGHPYISKTKHDRAIVTIH